VSCTVSFEVARLLLEGEECLFRGKYICEIPTKHLQLCPGRVKHARRTGHCPLRPDTTVYLDLLLKTSMAARGKMFSAVVLAFITLQGYTACSFEFDKKKGFYESTLNYSRTYF
jgi:hypothetical protein